MLAMTDPPLVTCILKSAFAWARVSPTVPDFRKNVNGHLDTGQAHLMSWSSSRCQARFLEVDPWCLSEARGSVRWLRNRAFLSGRSSAYQACAETRSFGASPGARCGAR